MGKIGIMGGTFDPIHNGHLHLGLQAYSEYDLDFVWYMPAGQPPHKKDHKVTEAVHRCNMTRLAIEEHPEFVFSDFEVSRDGNTYTAQTMELLTSDYPQHEFYFIIGADSLYELEKWYDPGLVMRYATLLVAGREYQKAHKTIDQQIAYLRDKYQADILRLHCTEVDISSEEIRDMLTRGKDVLKYVPKPVLNYIRENSLYG